MLAFEIYVFVEKRLGEGVERLASQQKRDEVCWRTISEDQW